MPMLFAFEALAPEMFATEAFGAEALGSALGAEALMGLGAEALGAGAVGGAEAALGAEAMAADAAAGGAGAGAANINAAQVAAQQSAAQGINAIPQAMSPAQQAYQAASSASAAPGITPGVQPLPAYTNNFLPYSFESSLVPAEASAINTSGGIASPTLAAPPPSPPMGLEMPGAYSPGNIQGASPNFFNPSATVAPGQGPLPNPQFQLNAPNAGQSLRLGTGLNSIPTPGPISSVLPPPSGLEAGFDKAIKFAEKNPFTAMTGAYMGASALGLLNPSGNTFNDKPYDGPLSRYKLSPNFQGSFANPANFQYNPATNRRYAEGGGIMNMTPQQINPPAIRVGYDEGGDVPSYASGGSLSDSIASYQKMLGGQPQAAPAASRDVGIYYDLDPDTRYQDALTAAQIRQAKVNQRAYVSPPVAKRPTPLGKLNMPTSAKSKESSSGDVEARHGGIMHASLGDYAAGGNPRLLKGPGDGMSDNIPATINGRQPARLADGEFVIPADVVSHLGNGSTEAGAKQLHAMMNNIRKARTGNSKQGKQIKPQKYMPR